MITHFRHVGLVVRDLDKSMRFYCELLGFKVKVRAEEEGSFISTITGLKNNVVTTVKMSAPDGNLLELLHFKNHPTPVREELKFNDMGLTHFALTVSDLQHTFQKLSEYGTQFISEPQVNPEKTAKVAFCRDPEGVFLELVQVL